MTGSKCHKNLYFLVFLAAPFVFFLGTSEPAKGQDRYTAANFPSRTLFRPADTQPKDQTYREFFSSQDDSIVRSYSTGWNYHESQIHYTSYWRNEHYALGGMNYVGKTALETDMRYEFALQVLRMRIEGAVNNYITSQKVVPQIRRAHYVMTHLRNQTIAISSNTEQTGEFKFGYDIISDASKFEYIRGNLIAGVYHPKLITDILGDSPHTATLRVSKHLGEDIATASIACPINADYLETSITKHLSPTLSTQLLTVQPFQNPTVPRSYHINLTHTF